LIFKYFMREFFDAAEVMSACSFGDRSMPGHPISPVVEVKLAEEEAEYLFALIHKGTARARKITRARVLSKLAQGCSNPEVSSALDVSLATVIKLRRRYAEGGLAAALEERPRPGQKPKLTAKQAAQITAIACSKAPDGHAHWTLRMLADQVVQLGFADSVSHEAVRQLLKKRSQTMASSAMVHSGSR
jgi:transposase